jgi:uncharacterized membrane protein
VAELLTDTVNVLVGVVEACGVIVVVIGAVSTFARFVWVGLRERSAAAGSKVRLSLGRFLALGLEFQLASDILRTAVAPSFRELGQLAVVATIRTVLNYFLAKEIAEEQRQMAGQDDGMAGPAAATGTA